MYRNSIIIVSDKVGMTKKESKNINICHNNLQISVTKMPYEHNLPSEYNSCK